jgi:serine/threonine protein kinase
MQIARVVVDDPGHQQGKKFVIRPGQKFVVGRSEKVSVRLEHPSISRRHALLELIETGLRVTDLGSSNGSFLDSVQLKPHTPTQVDDGQFVVFGTYRTRIELEGFDAKSLEQSQAHKLEDQSFLPKEEFTLVAELGSGSYGRVWAAWQKLMDRMVAVKVLRITGAIDPESEEYQRFVREASLGCKIRSPYVVELYDFRLIKGTPCLIMELVQGPTLLDLINDGPLRFDKTLSIGMDVARALDAVSKVGIVHRDVKPANVLLDEHGTAKLADFGIAREAGGMDLTQTGLGLGSLPYVAPEQAENAKNVDSRTDVYSLGATMFHMLTGEPPYPARARNRRELETILRRIASEPPTPVSALRPKCPAELSALIARMMAKRPKDRPQSHLAACDEFQALLARLRPPREEDDHGPPTEARRRPRG